MKTIEELNALKESTKATMLTGDGKQDFIRIVVGLATCGIAAGARPVMDSFHDEIARRKLTNIAVTQTGCIGMCQYEPIVEVIEQGKEKVTYVRMTADKVARIVNEHLVNGNVVVEYTVGAIAK
jgi:NADP-reducing hydrogenase subunit HndB